jgi:hypothetical protein
MLACCLAVTGTLGFWAGGAAAQTSDGWFDDSAHAPPPPVDEGDGPSAPSQPDYSPPPADFQTPAPAAAPAPADDADVPEDDASAQTRAVQEFSPRLEPYGRWVDDPVYGRVWVPSRSVVGSEFVPYSTGGHWELTPEDTWLWASDYPFGWITFHYGRWVWSSGGAWGWVPGYVYSPAWVDFRIGATGYIGWAPLGPTYVWRNGVFLSVGVYHPAPYVYCPTQYVFVRTMPRYVVRDNYRVRAISAQSHPVRPRYLSRGGVSYVSRGPSPREAHIPVGALPSRRVIAQPRLAPFSGNRQTRLESSTYSGNRSNPANRSYLPNRSNPANRGYLPNRSYPSERAPAVRPQSYDRYRAPAVPQRQNPAVRPPAPSPSNGWYGRGSEGWHERGGDRGFSPNPAQRMQPNRGAPAPAPRGGYRPLPYNGAGRGGAPGAAAPRAVAPAARPAPGRRGQRKDGNNSSGDSHVRGRAPQR